MARVIINSKETLGYSGIKTMEKMYSGFPNSTRLHFRYIRDISLYKGNNKELAGYTICSKEQGKSFLKP